MLCWLSADDPPDAFPDPDETTDQPEGLVAVGGDLSNERLLAAYRRGIFPWYEEGQPILWWSPEPRCVIYPHDIHVPRRLQRTLRSRRFTLSANTAFEQVVQGCAAPRRYTDATWITSDMLRAYLSLHRAGYAQSVEAWSEGALAGGIYGVILGRVFFGESMFSRARDASKVVLVSLAQALAEADFQLIDCQLPSPHLMSLGARLIPRRRFIAELTRHCSDESLQPYDLSRLFSDK